jgi:hypothetical protein
MGFMDRLKGAAESAQAMTSKVGVGADAGQMALANKAQKLTKVGVDTPATIDSLTPTGKTDAPGGAENVIELTVKPGGGEPYAVTINQYLYPSNPRAVGDDVNVKVDPDDAQTVMLF